MAVWFLSTDYRTAISLTFLVAGSILTPCLCAPTPNPWWFDSCVSPTERYRHGRSTDQNLVRTQLRTFINNLNSNIIKDLDLLYKEVNKTKTPFKGRLPWLKLKKMLKKMKDPANMLGEFHQALQFFAGTLEKLSKIKIETNASQFKEKERVRIFRDASNYLKLLLCEVVFTLHLNNLPVPPGIPLEKMDIRLPKKMDLTGIHLLDFNFFKKMKTFFTRSQQMFKAKKKRMTAPKRANRKNERSVSA